MRRRPVLARGPARQGRFALTRHRRKRGKVALASASRCVSKLPEQPENSDMDTEIEPRILDLIDWLAERERTYEEVKYAWRGYRARVSIWKEANRRGLVTIKIVNGRRAVRPTSLGLVLGELRREARRQVRQLRSSGTSSSASMFEECQDILLGLIPTSRLVAN